MRKHKSVVAILLAVIMIFTFMPTMAFANTQAGPFTVKKWDDSATGKYGTVVGTNPDYGDVTFNARRGFFGGIIAAVPQNKIDPTVGGTDYTAPDSAAAYWDLDGSSFVYGAASGPITAENKATALDGTEWTQDAFEDLLTGTTKLAVQLVEPEYTDSYKDSAAADPSYKAKKHAYEIDSTTGKVKLADGYVGADPSWNIYVECSEYESGKESDQTVTFSVKSIDPKTGVVIDGMNHEDLFGTIPSATVTVKGKAKTPATAKFYLDEVKSGKGSTTNLRGIYDGATHKVVADATPGYSVSYFVKNTSTGKYEKKDEVTITDVQETATSFYAVFTDAKGNESPRVNMTLNLLPNNVKGKHGRDTEIGFNKKESVSDDYDYDVPGATYNADEYVLIAAEEVATTITDHAGAKDSIREDNARAKSAVGANMLELKAWFEEMYEVKDVSTKADALREVVKLQISMKELTSKEKEEIAEKHAQMLKNLGTPVVDVETVATVHLNMADDPTSPYNARQVWFQNTPVKKTYKAKTLKKKAQKFSVSAVADNGAVINYKLTQAPAKIVINNTTGQITLKKGLAKGTYKIKAVAYVKGNEDVSESQTITIKVKKK